MANMTKTTAQKEIVDKEVKTSQETVQKTPNQDPLYAQLLERIEKMEKDNEELKWNKITNPKSRYDWPRKYSYKMWNWIPICNYSSKKLEEARDFAYQNQFWQLVDNHLLVLELANGKKIETPMWEFHKWYTKSDYIFPKEDRVQEWYVIFEWENGEDFKVMTKIIN